MNFEAFAQISGSRSEHDVNVWKQTHFRARSMSQPFAKDVFVSEAVRLRELRENQAARLDRYEKWNSGTRPLPMANPSGNSIRSTHELEKSVMLPTPSSVYSQKQAHAEHIKYREV